MHAIAMLYVLIFLALFHNGYAVAPVFTLPSPNVNDENHKLKLDENKKKEDLVEKLTATDTDTPQESLIFSMDTSPPTTRNLFEIVNRNELKVKTTVPENYFDFEKVNAVHKYEIILKVTDKADTATVTTSIYIIDINEKPVFAGSEPYNVYVEQSSAPGTSVYKVIATDADAGNTVTYAMSGAQEFQIDSSTGVVKVTTGTVFNRATKPDYSTTVTATDSGNPRLAAATTIKFIIANKPSFTAPAAGAVANVNENSAIGTSVYTVAIVDTDTASSGLTVTIKSQTPNSPTDMFKLDSNNVLRTNKNAFDAETQRTYAIKFQVTDGIFTVESATLTVNVNDLNDNIPAITPVSPILIPENKPLGTASVVVDVAATDNDISVPNNDLTYSIVSGNTDTTFGIVAKTGVIYLLKAPKSSQYILKVRVSDGGTAPKSQEIDITVNVNANTVNECANNPCQNGGACTPSLNSYLCTCAKGYAGSSCETNINDCANSPCKNGGACVDKVNAFECTCAAGYTGSTCETVCSNNKYGAGCSQTCNCNASRLIENVGTQTCNHRTGYCLCNSKWTGPACETDIDECTNTNLCKTPANKICENTLDGYYCACQVGYNENADKSCAKKTSTETLTAGPNEYKITLTMTVDKACVANDLLTPTKEAALRASTVSMLLAKVTPAVRAIAYNFKCGSLVFDSQIIIPNTDADKSRAASDLQNIRNGDAVAIEGVNTKATAMKVNGYDLSTTSGNDNTATKVCRVYSTLVTCPTDQSCQYVDNKASCRPIQKEEEDDNTELILGLGLGLGLPLILMVIVAVACCFWVYNRRQYKENEYRRDRDRSSYDYKDDYRRSYDRARDDYGDYLEKREFYGLPSYRY